MRMSRTSACLGMVILAAAATLSDKAAAATLSLVGSSTKVCQLIGETDWASGQPTAAQTLSNFGLDAVDLGFPVDSGRGPLYLLFGDAIPDGHPPGSIPTVPPDDALGFTTRTAVPDSTTCLDLQLAISAPKTFAHPTVHPPIQQGTFNVPTGGVFLNDALYAFFWTDHCLHPGILAPEPNAPLTLPPPIADCPQTPDSNSVGRGVLATATQADPVDFYQSFQRVPRSEFPKQLATMPNGFVYVTAATRETEIRPLPHQRQPGIPVFGVARYRASIPYLAIAPRGTFDDPDTWSFFAGYVGGHPYWVTRQQWDSGRNASGQ